MGFCIAVSMKLTETNGGNTHRLNLNHTLLAGIIHNANTVQLTADLTPVYRRFSTTMFAAERCSTRLTIRDGNEEVTLLTRIFIVAHQKLFYYF